MRLKFLPVLCIALGRIRYLFLCLLFRPTFVQVKWTYSRDTVLSNYTEYLFEYCQACLLFTMMTVLLFAANPSSPQKVEKQISEVSACNVM